MNATPALPVTMQAMVLLAHGRPLQLQTRPCPQPGPGEVLIEIDACGVCRTDLHVVDGELPDVPLPRVPGHQIVGHVLALGAGVQQPLPGTAVGVTWLAATCGDCAPCRRGRENLCERARFTGYQVDGGYASHCLARADFVEPLPAGIDATSFAPLLCGGVIGYRALRLCGDAYRIGLYGFGSAAHLVAQIAVRENCQVHAFTRPGDRHTQQFARELGAVWAGGSDENPPAALDAAIIFAADGALVPRALRAVVPGGIVVCAGIHMSEIPAFDYALLWGERSLCSVANLRRSDVHELLATVARAPIRAQVRSYALADANAALDDLRAGRIEGSAVLRMR